MIKNAHYNRNPEGRGGFGMNPQNRSNGTWDKNNSFGYWLGYFKQLSVKEFKDYEKTKPDEKRTVAESLAYARMAKARTELAEFKEVADRTEGRPRQVIEQDITTNGQSINNTSDTIKDIATKLDTLLTNEEPTTSEGNS
jgi:hypothetical protein